MLFDRVPVKWVTSRRPSQQLLINSLLETGVHGCPAQCWGRWPKEKVGKMCRFDLTQLRKALLIRAAVASCEPGI